MDRISAVVNLRGETLSFLEFARIADAFDSQPD